MLGQIAGNARRGDEDHGFLLSPSPQGQLQNVLTVINQINADRAVSRRTGTGYFVYQALSLLDEAKTDQACTALQQFQTDATSERPFGYLNDEELGELTSAVAAIQAGIGCR